MVVFLFIVLEVEMAETDVDQDLAIVVDTAAVGGTLLVPHYENPDGT